VAFLVGYWFSAVQLRIKAQQVFDGAQTDKSIQLRTRAQRVFDAAQTDKSARLWIRNGRLSRRKKV